MRDSFVSFNENIWVENDIVNLFFNNLNKSLKFVVCRRERRCNILFIPEEFVFYKVTLLTRKKSVIQMTVF
jgi:hypothetical protein